MVIQTLRIIRLYQCKKEKYLLDKGLTYLSVERDTRGYSRKYGWVHAFAHGADLLTEVACHPDFPSSRMPEVLEVIHQVFKKFQSVSEMMRIGA